MTNNDKKLAIIIGGGIVIIFVIYIIWLQFADNTADDTIVNVNNSTSTNLNLNTATIDLTNTDIKQEEIVLDENLTMFRLANIFTERYGSYTSESEFKNTLELKVYMTDSLKKWVDNYLALQSGKSELGQSVSGEYFSIITKVISTKIINQDDSSGTVELITRRVETKGVEESTYYQNIELELVNDNDIWLVDKITWGDKQ